MEKETVYEQLIRDLKQCDEMQTTLKTDYDFENFWLRRFFRLYLDGSYTNYYDYKNNCKRLKACNGNVKKLRAFIVPKFIAFIKTEYSELSEYKIRKAIKQAFNYSKNNITQLELFNSHLIIDALDLINELEAI
tara:strand:+ start:531 stop:932 length:402 start_codon:yes stop_codon:yes gene_type:complete